MTVTNAFLTTSSESAFLPLHPFGGISLIERALLNLQRAGVRTCVVLAGPGQSEQLQGAIEKNRQITVPIVWLDKEAGARGHCADVQSDSYVLSYDMIFRPALLEEIARQEGRCKSPDVQRLDYGPVLVSSDRLSSVLGDEGFTNGSGDKGPRASTASGCGRDFYHRLGRGDILWKLEKKFLLALENPRDGIVDHYFNRKISRFVTRQIVTTQVTPNQVTALAFTIGLLGAGCFLFGHYTGTVAGAILLQISTILDCVDGEIARVKMLETDFGEWLDVTLDTIVHIAVFLCIGVAVWKQNAITVAPHLGGILALGAAIAFPLVTLAERTEEQGRRRAGWEDALLEKLVAGLTSRDYSLLVLLCAVFGTLAWFLWAAAAGAHVFWFVLAFLLWKAGRFTKLFHST